MTGEQVLAVVSAIFLSSGFWNFITKWWETNHAKETVETRAILALLHDKMYYLCRRYIQEDEITPSELENLTWLYEPYHEMGGNGTCEQLYQDCKKLKKRKEDK